MLKTLNNIMGDLNNEQLKAVSYLDGPLLVLAGAGTGKTKVLTSKIAYILEQGFANSTEILAVTFTNKAAKEMLHRVQSIVDAPGIWLGTFHSIATRILRKNANLLDLQDNFTIIDADDQLRLIKTILKEQNLDSEKLNPKFIASTIQRMKDEGITPDNLETASGKYSNIDSVTKKIYILYQARLKSLSAVDFGDLLLYNIELFKNYPNILYSYQSRFKYILVDEYQDTNSIQYLWLKMLGSVHGNICCVGDEDQSIYGWRGAKISNILRFEKDFPGATVVRLEQNYRSTNNILNSASGIIANNAERLGKKLWTEFGEGEKVRVVSANSDRDEAEYISKEIIKLKNQGYILSEIAILFRASAQTRVFEESFLTFGLPYKVIGGQKFYSRQEIRDIIAYLRIAVNPTDNFAFERIINVPKRGIGATSVAKIFEHCNIYKTTTQNAIHELIAKGELKGKTKASLEEFSARLDRWNHEAQSINHVSLADKILNESGYLKMWQEENTIESKTRLENINELIRALGDFQNINEFLDYVSLVSDNDGENSDNMVNLMTLHGAKGLEFNCVFLPCWEEGIFPNQRCLDEQGKKGLEEERRLAYVGITRAKRLLYISHCASRYIYGSVQLAVASRFIAELPEINMQKFKTQNSSYQFANKWHRPIEKREYSRSNYEMRDSKAKFRDGERIFHDKFGYGTVISSLDDQVEISFEQGGYKTILENFLRKI